MVSTRGYFVDEREDIQKKAFTKWINNRLAGVSSFICLVIQKTRITNLFIN